MFKYVKDPYIISKYEMPSNLIYSEINNIDFEVKIYEFENNNLQGQLFNFEQGQHFLGYSNIGIIAKNNIWTEQDFFELLDFVLTEFSDLYERNTRFTIDNLFLLENKLEHCDIPSFMRKYGYNLQMKNTYIKNLKIPYFRFSEFIEEWKEIKLEEIADKIVRKNKNNETDLPLTISSIDGLVDQRTYFNKVVASRDMSGYYLLKKGEFSYNKSYSLGYDYGSIKRLDKYDMGALSTLYICFALKDETISDFLVKYFDSQKWYKEIYMISAEGARNHGLLNIPTEDFFKIKLFLPKELKEQQKIANFLSKVDEKIINQKAIVSDYEEIKKGLMQKIFRQEVRFKADDGSEYPEWEERKLLDVGTIVTGTTPPTKVGKYYSDKYLWVTPADIVSKEISNTAKRLSDSGLEKGRKVPANSVLITCIASIGKNAIIREDGSCNQQINALTPNEKYIVDFIYYLICFNENMLHVNAGQGGMEILNKEQFSKLNMYFPCIKEQQKIADCLSIIDRKIDAEKRILEDWKKLRKALLQQMFL